MKCGGDIVDGYTDDIERWVENPRIEENGEARWRQATPIRRRSKWEGSREIRDARGECRPVISREEWGGWETQWWWGEIQESVE